MHQKNVLPMVLVAIVIAIAGIFGIHSLVSGTSAGGIGGKTSTQGIYIAGLGFGIGTENSYKQVFNSTGQLVMSTTGTAITRMNFGFCSIVAYAATISASSTQTVDCSSNGSPTSGALTGITFGDVVIAQATTTIFTSTGVGGVYILSATASSTSGYLTLKIHNGTGAAQTWTGGASSTIQYQVMH